MTKWWSLVSLLCFAGCVAEPATAAEETALSTVGVAALSFTFDDGYASDMTAQSILASHSLTGASYVITDTLGTTGRLSWAQLNTLDGDGWEIGSHTLSHRELVGVAYTDTTNFGTDPTLAQCRSLGSGAHTFREELRCSQVLLADQLGHPVVGFAWPKGSYDQASMAAAAQYYHYVRRAYAPDPDHMINTFPFNRHRIEPIRVTWCDTVQTLKERICYALSDDPVVLSGGGCRTTPLANRWAVLVFHDIQSTTTTPSTIATACTSPRGVWTCCGNPEPVVDEFYNWPSTDLDALASWVHSYLGAQVVRPVDVFGARSGSDFIARGVEFNNSPQMDQGAMLSPYTNPSGGAVHVSDYGVSPTGWSAISISAAPLAVHNIQSASLTTYFGSSYIAEATLNLSALGVGTPSHGDSPSIGLYVDEFSSSHTWISGRLIASCVGASCVGAGVDSIRTFNGVYTPTSSSVQTAQLQVYVYDGSGSIRVDNVSLRMF